HHQLPVGPRVFLRPLHSVNIFIEVLGALWKVRQVDIRQIDEMLSHILPGDLDEMSTNAVSHSTRSTMQQEPDGLRLIQTNLDEMISGSQRSQMVHVASAIQLRM